MTTQPVPVSFMGRQVIRNNVAFLFRSVILHDLFNVLLKISRVLGLLVLYRMMLLATACHDLEGPGSVRSYRQLFFLDSGSMMAHHVRDERAGCTPFDGYSGQCLRETPEPEQGFFVPSSQVFWKGLFPLELILLCRFRTEERWLS